MLKTVYVNTKFIVDIIENHPNFQHVLQSYSVNKNFKKTLTPLDTLICDCELNDFAIHTDIVKLVMMQRHEFMTEDNIYQKTNKNGDKV